MARDQSEAAGSGEEARELQEYTLLAEFHDYEPATRTDEEFTLTARSEEEAKAREESDYDIRFFTHAGVVDDEAIASTDGRSGLDTDRDHPLMLGKRWGDRAEENIEKWGNQRHDTLLLALIEEVAEIAMAMEANNGPGDGHPPNAVDHDQPEVVGRELISDMAELGRRTRDFLENEYGDPAGDGDSPDEIQIHGEPTNATRILEEVEDTAPLCWQLYWALQEAQTVPNGDVQAEAADYKFTDCPEDGCEGELQYQTQSDVMCLSCEEIFAHEIRGNRHLLWDFGAEEVAHA